MTLSSFTVVLVGDVIPTAHMMRYVHALIRLRLPVIVWLQTYPSIYRVYERCVYKVCYLYSCMYIYIYTCTRSTHLSCKLKCIPYHPQTKTIMQKKLGKYMYVCLRYIHYRYVVLAITLPVRNVHAIPGVC